MSSIIQASSALRKRKTLKRGINFTLMVVGQSGCGRSTFINTLCGQQVVDVSTTILLPTDTSTEIDLQLREETVELEDEEGVKIQLNIIDTPGFGDSLDNTASFEIISDYIRHQYDEILLEESRVKRNPRFKDGRVHCCLYMITPSGHGLKEMDVEFMRRLGNLVNIIPVLSKSDSLTPEELKLNKKLVMDDIDRYNLPIYNFPFDEDEISQEDYDTNMFLRSTLPFSVIGSNEVYDMGNDMLIRGRKYPWGMLDVEDATISDFVILRNTLLISHLHDLKDYTHEILYERYRTEALSGESVPYGDGESNNNNNNNINSRSNNRAWRDKQQGDKEGSIPTAEGVNSPTITGNDNANRNNDGYNGDGNRAGVSNGVGEGSQDTYLAREEQIRLEEERLRVFEERVQQELLMKRRELYQREQELREIEERLERGARIKQEE